MYINVNNSQIQPKMVDKVNGTAIIRFGHFGIRYDERVKRIQEELDIYNLKYRKVLLKTIDHIKDNYDEVITKDGKPVRTLVRDNITVKCLHQTFDIEINVLVKSTLVEWSYEYPKKVVKGYVDLLKNGDIKLGEPVICIETIIATVKCVDDNDIYGLEDMKDMTIIGDLRLPKHLYFKLSVDDFEYITEYLIDKKNGRTDNAAIAFNELKTRYA